MYSKDINTQALEILWRTDGYKTDHRRQYPHNTTRVYSNFTPRSVYGGVSEETPGIVVMFGLKRLLMDLVDSYQVFFDSDIDVVAQGYADRLEQFTGISNPDVSHVRELHSLGYLPLEIKAIPEGALGLIGHPVLTITNTHPSAFWLVNYLETWISTALWHPITSATTAWNIRRLMDNWTVKTGGIVENNGFQAHDFSYRGMTGVEAASVSGAAHLTSFLGSDSLSSWDYITSTYPSTTGTIQVGVPATEHAVMTAGAIQREDGTMDEREQIQRLIDLYPTGIVSVVSDSYDYWGMLTEILPEFKEQIMGRDGTWVIRPDSGNPTKIVTGDPEAPEGSPERKGSLQILWEIFGGTINDKGYKVLDSHVSMIYGDGMNWKSINDMCIHMEANGFATSNVVFGVGSYNYQGKTRDSLGMAVKATWVEVDGAPKPIFKDPKTGSGNKKSAKGILRLVDRHGKRELLQNVSVLEEGIISGDNVMQTVFRNGNIMNMDEDFQVIRQRITTETDKAKDNGWI